MLLVSFILPAYKASFLKQAIDSILAQTYSCFELVIVNDHSPENLDEIVYSYDDERIRYFVNAVNLGGSNLVAQWNHCLEFATGSYIVLAADDDLYHPDFLKNCIALAEKYPCVNLIRSRVAQIDSFNNLIGIDSLLPEYCSKYEYFYHWMAGNSFTCIGNLMFKTNVLKEKKFVDFPCAYGSDTATAIMMSREGVANTAEMLFSFRHSSIHLSGSKLYYKEKLRANTLLFQWLARLNYPKPVDCFDVYFFSFMQFHKLYSKCLYDYYNLVIKNLPVYKFYYIKYCIMLSLKDKIFMLFRFCFDKTLRRK